jgi:hypothetical protein
MKANLSILQQLNTPAQANGGKVKIDLDILSKALRPEEQSRKDGGDSEGALTALLDRVDSLEASLSAHDAKLDTAINMLAEIQQMELLEEEREMGNDEEGSDVLEKAVDLKEAIRKLGDVDDVEKDANNLPADLADLLKAEDGAPEAPAAMDEDEEDDEDDLEKALMLFGDQPVIHVIYGTLLHDMIKASGNHKYLRKYRTSGGKWAYVYAKQKGGEDSYSAESFKLDKISEGDKFNMGGGATVKIDRVDGNMVTFTGTDGKKQTLSAKAFGDRLLAGHKKALTNAAKAGVQKREQAISKAKEKNKPELVKKAQAELKSFQDKHKKLLTDKKDRQAPTLKEAFKQKQTGFSGRR